MPSPAPMEDSSSGCLSEQVLPAHPKQWAALPPNRNSARPPVATRSTFSTLLADLFKQLEDLHERLPKMLELQNSILVEHDLEVKRLAGQDHAEIEGEKYTDVVGMHKEHHVSVAADCVTYGSEVYGSEAPPSEPLGSTEDEQNVFSRASSAFQIIRESQARFSAISEYDMDPFDKVKSAGPAFDLRVEWQIKDEDIMRLAGMGTLKSQESESSQIMSVSTDAFIISKQVPLHPEHNFRLCWDMVAALLLAYDTIMLPLYLFEIQGSDATKALDWLTAIFWTFDILVSFCTGTYIKGRLEMHLSAVCKKYVKSWLAPDVLLVCVEWILIGMSNVNEQSDVLSSVGAVRNLRALRFVRLVRLFKFEGLLKQLTRRINSVYVLLSFRIIKMVVAIVVANHILASLWYSIGASGWVHARIPKEKDVLYCYLMSFHWSLTQFHGSSDIQPHSLKERVFAVLTLLFALVAVSWLVSSMTNSMLMLQNIHQERTSQQRSLLGFLGQRHVSKSLTVRIKEYIAMHNKDNPVIIQEHDVALLEVLPQSLLTDLHEEVRGRTISDHPLFGHLRDYFSHFVRQISHEAMREIHVSCKDVIFRTGQACNQMLFISSEMSYSPGALRMAQASSVHTASINRRMMPSQSVTHIVVSLGDGSMHNLHGRSWICEPVLWTVWANCGTLTALEDSIMYALQVEEFLKLARLYETVRLDMAVYGKIFMEFLQRGSPSDLASRVDACRVWAEIESKVDRAGRLSTPSSASWQPSWARGNRLSTPSSGSTKGPTLASSYLWAELKAKVDRSSHHSYHSSGSQSTLASSFLKTQLREPVPVQ